MNAAPEHDEATRGPDTLPGRIRECARRVGSGDALARKTGIPRGTLESYLTGNSEPKAGRLLSIARAAGVNLDWLVAGDGVGHVAETARGYAMDAPYQVAVYASTIDDTDAGWPQGAAALGTTTVPRDGMAGTQLAALVVRGDAMYPTLCPGDIVTVDCQSAAQTGEGLYALVLEGNVVVRRLRPAAGGGLDVLHDNPLYPPVHLPPGHTVNRVVGRAVFRCGRL